MGMDYIPVYEGEDEASGKPASPNQIRISTEKVQKLGVRTELATMRLLDKTVRAAGRVEPDERRIYVISPRFMGYVERLHVNVTGQLVGKGQPLFEVYSPELVSAQREYAIAMQGIQAMQGAGAEIQGGMKQLAESSLARLRNWDLSAARAIAMMELLGDKFGVPRNKLAIAGYADTIPMQENNTDDGRARNRRVDVVILARGGMVNEPTAATAATAAPGKQH